MHWLLVATKTPAIAINIQCIANKCWYGVSVYSVSSGERLREGNICECLKEYKIGFLVALKHVRRLCQVTGVPLLKYVKFDCRNFRANDVANNVQKYAKR